MDTRGRGGGCTPSLLQSQNDHDAFVDLEVICEEVIFTNRGAAARSSRGTDRLGIGRSGDFG